MLFVLRLAISAPWGSSLCLYSNFAVLYSFETCLFLNKYTVLLLMTLSYILHPASYILHPASYILYTASYILHPASYILHSASYIIHPASLILHPASSLLHPASYIKSLSNLRLILSYPILSYPTKVFQIVLVKTEMQCSPAIVLNISLFIYVTQRRFTFIDCFSFLQNSS